MTGTRFTHCIISRTDILCTIFSVVCTSEWPTSGSLAGLQLLCWQRKSKNMQTILRFILAIYNVAVIIWHVSMVCCQPSCHCVVLLRGGIKTNAT